MGEVISITRSTDDDLRVSFLSACPEVPMELNDTIHGAASHALGTTRSRVAPVGLSFKTVCLAVAGSCLVGVVVLRDIAPGWNDKVEVTRDLATPQMAAAVASLDFNPSDSMEGESTAFATAGSETQGSGTLVRDTSQESWQRSQSAWAAYIARLESDPYYQYVVQEKRRFEARHPSHQLNKQTADQ